MKLSAIDITTAADVLEDAAHVVIEAHRQRGGSGPDVVSPELLTDALRQFFAIMRRIDAPGTDESAPASIYDTLAAADPARAALEAPATTQAPRANDAGDISELGEHSLTSLADLGQWAAQLEQPRARQQIAALTVPVALWVARHGGVLRELEAVVNALAAVANATGEPELLRELSRVMGEITEAVAPELRQDLDRSDATRPWRILNLNRGIVATRSGDTAEMARAFEALRTHLPEDAPQFFAEGLRQAEAMGLPEPVRELIAEQQRRSGKTLH